MFRFLFKLRLKSCFVFFVLLSTTFTVNASPVGQWMQVAAGINHSIAIKANHTLWTWGNNSSGQLGDGTTTNKTTAVQFGSEA